MQTKNPVNEFGQEIFPLTPEEKARGLSPQLGGTPGLRAAMKRSLEQPPVTSEEALRQTRQLHGKA